MLGRMRINGLSKLARCASSLLKDVQADVAATSGSYFGTRGASSGPPRQGPPQPPPPPPGRVGQPWSPQEQMPDGSREPVDPAPAIYIVYQFLKQRGFHRCAGLLAMDAKEELEKMKQYEPMEVDLISMLEEYWYLQTCEDRRDQMASKNPFAEDLFRMIDAHMGVNPWQEQLPKPMSFMREAEEAGMNEAQDGQYDASAGRGPPPPPNPKENRQQRQHQHAHDVEQDEEGERSYSRPPVDPIEQYKQRNSEFDDEDDPTAKYRVPRPGAPVSIQSTPGSYNEADLKGYKEAWGTRPGMRSGYDAYGQTYDNPPPKDGQVDQRGKKSGRY
ncbi:hypothetical protein BSKO_11347 [Bryopsis sp. KO-2023]|nr:hypothetical protein BSKO_11347 [Bryopsis sp. KO-2023]